MLSSEYSKEELTEIITSVLESMHECREDVAVQWKGLVLLRKLTKNRIPLPLFYAPSVLLLPRLPFTGLILFHSENGSPLLLQKGGVTIIMRALRKHQTHDMISERGFQILQHLSTCNIPSLPPLSFSPLLFYFLPLLTFATAGRQFARDITVNGGLSVVVGALKCHTYALFPSFSHPLPLASSFFILI